METINLRKYYPNYYKHDYFAEVSYDVYETIQKAERQMAAYSRRIRKYKAYYYFTEDNYIEYDALSQKRIKTPCEMCETSALREQLYNALNSLSEKQARRIYARYFLNMRLKDIARIEGTGITPISNSINLGLKKLKRALRLKFLFLKRVKYIN